MIEHRVELRPDVKVELGRTYISGIERGVRNPTLRKMLRTCRAPWSLHFILLDPCAAGGSTPRMHPVDSRTEQAAQMIEPPLRQSPHSPSSLCGTPQAWTHSS